MQTKGGDSKSRAAKSNALSSLEQRYSIQREYCKRRKRGRIPARPEPRFSRIVSCARAFGGYRPLPLGRIKAVFRPARAARTHIHVQIGGRAPRHAGECNFDGHSRGVQQKKSIQPRGAGTPRRTPSAQCLSCLLCVAGGKSIMDRFPELKRRPASRARVGVFFFFPV